MNNRAIAGASLLLSFAGLAQAAPAELKIATWNLEWFMTPETLRALTPACTPADAPRDGARRAVPCDVAHELARSREDIAALRRHARTLDADVVALQEVDGPEAARLVFPDYQFCFSGRVAVQNNGFAIRRGLPFACGPDLADLSMNDDVRRGVELRVFPGTPQELRLLSVHLKSGCARDPLDSTAGRLRACSPARSRCSSAGSTPRPSEHKPFAVLGDFNRDLRREPAGASLWAGHRRCRSARRRPCQHGRRASFSKLHAFADLQRLHRLHHPGPPDGPGTGRQTPSDVRFSGQKTRSAASCQITARYSSGFGWQTPSAACRKPKDVKFFVETH